MRVRKRLHLKTILIGTPSRTGIGRKMIVEASRVRNPAGIDLDRVLPVAVVTVASAVVLVAEAANAVHLNRENPAQWAPTIEAIQPRDVRHQIETGHASTKVPHRYPMPLNWNVSRVPFTKKSLPVTPM